MRTQRSRPTDGTPATWRFSHKNTIGHGVSEKQDQMYAGYNHARNHYTPTKSFEVVKPVWWNMNKTCRVEVGMSAATVAGATEE